MKKEKMKYLIFRVYPKNDEEHRNNRTVLFGWTTSKDVLKAFMEQRDKRKYRSIKLSQSDIEEKFSEDVTDAEKMIDIIKLKSSKTYEEIPFFSTPEELRETEIKIQRYFHELSSLSSIKGNGYHVNDYINMFYNLDDYYKSALEYLGFRPSEMDILFPSADVNDDYSNLSKVEDQIEGAYDRFMNNHSTEEVQQIESLPGLSAIDDVANKIIYSLESFIKILKDDL